MIDVESLVKHPGCNPACRACHYKDFTYQHQLELKNDWAFKNLKQWIPVLEPILAAPANERLGYRKKAWLRSSLSIDPPHQPLQFGMVRSIRQDGIKGKKAWKKEFIHWHQCPIHSDFIKNVIESFSQSLRGIDLSHFMGMWVSEPDVVLVFRQKLDLNGSVLRDLHQLGFEKGNLWIHINPQAGNHALGTGPIVPLSVVQSRDNTSNGQSDHQPDHLTPSQVQRADSPLKAFKQVANTLLERARTLAMDHLMNEKPDCVLDLYSGAGQMAMRLPGQTSWIGIERSRDAVEFSKTLRHANLPTFHLAFTGAVEQRLRDPAIIEKLEKDAKSYALYLNPPRSGLSDEAVGAITDLFQIKRPCAISYLSCSASSLSRNLIQFEKLGYQVKSLQAFDFFPHTEHFETLANLAPVND